jgi:hypothetical protein
MMEQQQQIPPAARRRTKHTPTASRVGGQVKAELVAVGQSGEQT